MLTVPVRLRSPVLGASVGWCSNRPRLRGLAAGCLRIGRCVRCAVGFSAEGIWYFIRDRAAASVSCEPVGNSSITCLRTRDVGGLASAWSISCHPVAFVFDPLPVFIGGDLGVAFVDLFAPIQDEVFQGHVETCAAASAPWSSVITG